MKQKLCRAVNAVRVARDILAQNGFNSKRADDLIRDINWLINDLPQSAPLRRGDDYQDNLSVFR
jgi:hypothetical protein